MCSTNFGTFLLASDTANAFAPAFEKSYLCMHLVAPGASPPQHQAPLECRFETIMPLITRLGAPWHLLLSDAFERSFEWSPAKSCEGWDKGQHLPQTIPPWLLRIDLNHSSNGSLVEVFLALRARDSPDTRYALSAAKMQRRMNLMVLHPSWKFSLND